MDVRIIAFATASDILGKGSQVLTLPDGSRLSDVQTLLVQRFPALEPLWPRLAIAVDGELSRGDRALSDQAEIALLPPVSGGSDDAVSDDDASQRVDLVDEAIDLEAVERRVRGRGYGAVLLFLGTVRDHHAGRSVERLTYSAYRSMARQNLERIVRQLEDNPQPTRVAIVHRLGDVPVGEPSVVIATASPHRAAAYDANRQALERLKREVPIWKREHYSDGESVWREEEPLGVSSPVSEPVGTSGVGGPGGPGPGKIGGS